MKHIFLTLLGYLLGCLDPAYFISLAKHKDIMGCGTGNTGTTNAFICLGKACGCIVLFYDMAKAFAAVETARYLFQELALAGMVSGCAAVIGHIFPFYMRFHRGKGIEGFCGPALALDWKLFLLSLVLGAVLVLVYNYGCVISFSMVALFSAFYAYREQSVGDFYSLRYAAA